MNTATETKVMDISNSSLRNDIKAFMKGKTNMSALSKGNIGSVSIEIDIKENEVKAPSSYIYKMKTERDMDFDIASELINLM